MAVSACSPGTQESREEGQQVQGQSALHNELQDAKGFIVKKKEEEEEIKEM